MTETEHPTEHNCTDCDRTVRDLPPWEGSFVYSQDIAIGEQFVVAGVYHDPNPTPPEFHEPEVNWEKVNIIVAVETSNVPAIMMTGYVRYPLRFEPGDVIEQTKVRWTGRRWIKRFEKVSE